MARSATDTVGDRVRGTTLRWTFTEGPQTGKTYEHTFHNDGTVEYRAIEQDAKQPVSRQTKQGADSSSERPTFAAFKVSDDVYLVSYLAESGFTLTVALNFDTHRLASIASNNQAWFPARGTFEEVSAPAREKAA